MTNTTITHHIDCDGYRFAHCAAVQRVYGPSPRSPHMWRAECPQCVWVGTTFGAASRDDAQREAGTHIEEVRCDGRCSTWT